MPEGILLGFEVGTGEPVYIQPHHLAVFGMTQKSGKTTTLNALIHRSGLRGIAFITKRGESGFIDAHTVRPYYKHQTGWQYIESLVDVALGEKVKYEPRMRFAIMTVARGSKDLHQARELCREKEKTAKKSWDREVYSKLGAYLDLVLPELDKVDFADNVDLHAGVNVMDLIDMKLQTQQLIMASTMQYIYEHLEHVIVIVPEAWEMLPQSRKTPVKLIAEQFIRKGASVHNYMWLDSQDIGGIDKTPLRQVSTWILGRMMEAHEVERIGKQLLGVKVKAQDIQTLPLGHFYVTVGKEIKKVYVLPKGVTEPLGRMVALRTKPPEEIRDQCLKPKPNAPDKALEDLRNALDVKTDLLAQLHIDHKKAVEDRDLYKAQAEQSKKRNDELEQTIDEQVVRILELEAFESLANALRGIVEPVVNKATDELKKHSVHELQEERDWVHGHITDMLAHPDLHGIDIKIEAFLKDKIEEILEHPDQLNIKVKAKQTKLVVEKTVHPLVLSTESHQGMIATLYAEGKFPDEWFTTKAIMDLYMARGMKRNPRTIEYLKNMCKWGFLESRVEGKKARDFRVLLPPDEAKKKGLLTVKEITP